MAWSYVFLMMLMFLFSLYAAGRSLGLDALLRREVASLTSSTVPARQRKPATSSIGKLR
jgi:hypothetical protein